MNHQESSFDILDCTLRDGSYVNDFQFTAEDTKIISKALEDTGFNYIEIGHGVGLGASENTSNVAAATDLDYMKAAHDSLTKAKWGMFCIPGIASLDHLSLAADQGMQFVRIGVNVTEVEKSKDFIQKAKTLGMEVCTNFMKSYVLDPLNFSKQAQISLDFGSDYVYLVDSAGSMLPSEVSEYIKRTLDLCEGIKLGYHGHDNLGLSVANSLISVQLGAKLIDTSLQGYGRSAGNTSTEQFLSAIIRSGYSIDLDPLEVMHAGEKYIRPLILKKGISSLDTVSGQAQFHSSYMPLILKFAKKNRIDPRALIVELCKINKVDAPEELVSKIAKQISRSNPSSGDLFVDNYFGEEQNL
tara:strand:+ start:19701 stop:20768 length:1068 start_codon:yes stop_codon:yes gene_type:complete